MEKDKDYISTVIGQLVYWAMIFCGWRVDETFISPIQSIYTRGIELWFMFISLFLFNYLACRVSENIKNTLTS